MAETIEIATEKALTIEEIEKQFDAEWVLIADPHTDEQLNVLSGRVLYHSKDRLEFDRETLKLPLGEGRFAVLYLGEPLEGMEFAL